MKHRRTLAPPDYTWVSWAIAIVLGLAIGALTLPYCYPTAELAKLGGL